MTPAIAIIGAGPSGLLLSRLLQHLGNISSTIFELDSSSSARGQGGTLDIHEETGQRALKAAGLSSEFQKHMRPEGDYLRLADKAGFIHIDEETPGEGRPEIDRTQLRQFLINSVPAKSIEWASKVASVRPTPDGHFRVVLTDRSEDPRSFDLVVGADGAWSRVRPLVTNVLPFYSGISGVEVRFHNVDTAHPEISKLVGQGSYFCLSDEKACFAQRQGDGSIRNYAILRAPESWIDDCGIDFSNPQATKAALLEQYFDDWSEANKDLIRLADDDQVIARKLMMLPVDHRWTSRPGVTLMGDAAHVMTPFAGEGVNNAMVDALELAENVVAALRDGPAGTMKENLAKAVKDYEKGMFARVHGIAHETLQGLGILFSKNAPLEFKEMMEGFKAGGRDVTAIEVTGSGFQTLVYGLDPNLLFGHSTVRRDWNENGYGRVTLISNNIPLVGAWSLPFPSEMSRSAVLTDLIFASGPGHPLVKARLANVRLESLSSGAKARAVQLNLTAERLRDIGVDFGIVGGDMNAISDSDRALPEACGLDPRGISTYQQVSTCQPLSFTLNVPRRIGVNFR
ncbi:hypothetical protein DFS33DRAFT_1453606 [Desarmillaria ectypa]|nr:hypothetical protein DFS33DRAFT_1453606 [Desarmillaria ectypa]